MAAKAKPAPAPAPTDLADRIRRALAGRAFTETRMFGGTAFMIGGKMVASASKRGLLVRVGKDGQAAALKDTAAKRVEMGRGRPMSGFIRVAEDGLSEADLARWLDLGIGAAQSLPAKPTVRSTRTPKVKSARGE